MLRRLGPHKGLSRVIGRPLYHVTLQHYSERVTSNIPPYRWLARFSFAFFGQTNERSVTLLVKADIFYVTFVKSKQFRRCQNFDDIWRALKSIATLVQSRAERFSMQNDRLAVQSRINLHSSSFSAHALTLKMSKSSVSEIRQLFR